MKKVRILVNVKCELGFLSAGIHSLDAKVADGLVAEGFAVSLEPNEPAPKDEPKPEQETNQKPVPRRKATKQ